MLTSHALAYVGLGSNLDDPLNRVERACQSIAGIEGLEIVQISPWYESKAIGPGEQPDFINGVAAVKTQLEPLQLLKALQAIEDEQGRQRLVRWGARTLDLDLLIYGDTVMDCAQLTLPHPHLHQRNFVVYPLADVAPQLVLPSGESIASLRQQLGTEGLRRL